MPPKAKFTKEQIIEAALEIIRQEGINRLTARELGSRLGSSARPTFTIFKNMEEVQKEAIKAARALYNQYVQKGLKGDLGFKGVGIQYIQFAREEPKLFQLLFMTENKREPKLSNVLSIIDDNYEEILLSVQKDYELDTENSWKLYRHLWLYTHGIATLCATKACLFTDKEIKEMLSETFTSILVRLKENENVKG